MVTEEERLFLYHVYTEDSEARIDLGIRRRLAPLLGGDRRKTELMNEAGLPGGGRMSAAAASRPGDDACAWDRGGTWVQPGLRLPRETPHRDCRLGRRDSHAESWSRRYSVLKFQRPGQPPSLPKETAAFAYAIGCQR